MYTELVRWEIKPPFGSIFTQ